MEVDKRKALDAFVASLGFSKQELDDWYNRRCKNETNLIPTKLPLVYRRGNELTVENGLNLNRKSELWGIQLLSGVMMALKCGSGDNVSATTWEKVKKFAEEMYFNGKPGFLPSKDVLKEHWGGEEEAKFAATVKVLRENEIETDNYWGYLWCSEEYNSDSAYYVFLLYGGDDYANKNTVGNNERVALAF